MRIWPDVAAFVCKGLQEECSPANSLIVVDGALCPTGLEDKYVLFQATKFVVIFYSNNEELIQHHVINAQWKVEPSQKKERECAWEYFFELESSTEISVHSYLL